MFGIVTKILALPTSLHGYRTYIVVVIAVLSSIVGWGTEALLPMMDGEMGMIDFIKFTADWLTAGTFAAAIGYAKAGIMGGVTKDGTDA